MYNFPIYIARCFAPSVMEVNVIQPERDHTGRRFPIPEGC